MDRTVRIIIIVAGVLCYAAGAAKAAGWSDFGNATAWALIGFAFWLASTLP